MCRAAFHRQFGALPAALFGELAIGGPAFEQHVAGLRLGFAHQPEFFGAGVAFGGLAADELVLAVHNSTADEPALCLASAGKIGNRDESGYNIAWCLNLEPYTALLNLESLFIAKGTNSPAGARLFVRYITGGADGQSEGMKPFKKEGNWPIRDDVEDKKNPAELTELGARRVEELLWRLFYGIAA